MNSYHNFQSITCLFLKVVEKRAVLSDTALELHWIIGCGVVIFCNFNSCKSVHGCRRHHHLVGSLRSDDGCCYENVLSIKIELYGRLSVLRLFQVGQVVRNRRSLLSLAWHEWFSKKGREWKIFCCGLALSAGPQIWKFHVIWQTTSKNFNKKRKILIKILINFSSFNPSNHWFMALPSFLKLPSDDDDDNNEHTV